MNFKRLTNPEISTNPEVGSNERVLRKVGGYTLGLLGYASGFAAISNAIITGGLSVPVFGGLSGALFVGSRAILRPAYQSDSEYEDVKEEDLNDKVKRIAAQVGGFALLNMGANALVGGLFNALPGVSMSAPTRIISTIFGGISTIYGSRFIRGSFDPELHSEQAQENPRVSLFSRVKESFVDGYRSAKGDLENSRQTAALYKADVRRLTDDFRRDVQELVDSYTGDDSADSRSEFDREISQLQDHHRGELDKVYREWRASRQDTASPILI